MKAVSERLERLEARFGTTSEAMRRTAGPSVAEELAKGIAAWGIVRGPNESVAEMTARAMGISVREFRAQLLRRAAGLPASEVATDITA